MWKERNQRGVVGDPPCDGCEDNVELGDRLLDENFCAAKVYYRVRNQILVYHNGEHDKEFDLNHVAVWAAIDHFPQKVLNPFEVFELVTDVYHHFLRERNNQSSD